MKNFNTLDVILACLKFDFQFELYTYDSHFQFGAVIGQENSVVES